MRSRRNTSRIDKHEGARLEGERVADSWGADHTGRQTRQKRQGQRKQKTTQAAAVPASQSSKKLAAQILQMMKQVVTTA